MKSFFKRFQFKPKEIKANCEEEGMVHKAKVVCFSVGMMFVCGMFTAFFDDLVYRSGRFQERAIEGELSFYIYDERTIKAALWQWKNELDVLEDKDFKDLVYIKNNWASMSYQNYLNQNDPNPTTRYNTPNGYPYDNQGYFTQRQRYDSWYDWEVARYNTHQIQWDATLYDNWKTSVEDVVWFDTKPCL